MFNTYSMLRTATGLAVAALIAQALAGCSGGTQTLPSRPQADSTGPTSRIATAGNTFTFHGRTFHIGSAAAKARAIQKREKPNVVLPPGALYVADPSLNGVMVYNEFSTGANVLPYGILAGAQSQVDGPVAVALGTDLPCNPSCTQYLWVANAGNNTISYYTLPLSSWNQAPAGVIAWNGTGSCGPGISNPYGIVHYGPFGTTAGTILETSETLTSSSNYYIVGFQADLTGMQSCDVAFTTPNYDSPSGPSIYQGAPDQIFNANRNTVSGQGLTGTLPPAFGTPAASWALPSSAATEGTAVQQGPIISKSYVWVTTSKNATYPNDALWRCRIDKLDAVLCATAQGGGSAPVCVNPAANLDNPAFPATSAQKEWIYVPNISNGTVTSYKLAASCTQKATFVNTVSPFGVAVQY